MVADEVSQRFSTFRRATLIEADELYFSHNALNCYAILEVDAPNKSADLAPGKQTPRQLGGLLQEFLLALPPKRAVALPSQNVLAVPYFEGAV